MAEKIIDLRAFDAKEPTNSDSERKSYGNNRYKDSNIRQWFNNSEMNNWYVPQHSADAPPNGAGVSEPTGYDE